MTNSKDTDFKEQLRTAYDADAERRVRSEKSREDWKLTARKDFADVAKKENKQSLLEIGAGAGIDASYFQEQGFDVLAVDLSPQMVNACKERGLEAKVFDIYDLAQLGRQFDAIYSLNVLLHVPKDDLPHILELIHDSLTPNGIFFYGVYGGPEQEETSIDSSRMNLPRFFSFLSDQTQLQVVSPYFEVIESKSIKTNDGHDAHGLHFQSLLLRKR